MTNFTASPQRFAASALTVSAVTTENNDNVSLAVPVIQPDTLSRSQFTGLGVYLTIAGKR